MSEGSVLSDPDLKTVYELPLIFEEEGLDKKLSSLLEVKSARRLGKWADLVDVIKKPHKKITVAIAGKYTELADSYISIIESLSHAGAHHGVQCDIKWLETTDFEKDPKVIGEAFKGIDGLIVPGGFGSRGTTGKILTIKYAREHNVPFLGICFGLQLAVVEFARNMCNLSDAHSTEIDAKTKNPVVDIMEHQKSITTKGHTMRLGSHKAILTPGVISSVYKKLTGDGKVAYERHRHRYEVNPAYHKVLREKGLQLCGLSEDGTLVEFIELPNHPYFVATQAHPELKSRLEKPAPLFYGFVEACLQQTK